VPCIFGVLTCDDMDQAKLLSLFAQCLNHIFKFLLFHLILDVQALNRAGGKSGNKGAEAALTAVSFCFSLTISYGVICDVMETCCYILNCSFMLSLFAEQIEMASLCKHHLS
jgi:hypothetical protein